MQETCVWSVGPGGLLEKGMATHSSVLACKIPWTEEPGRLQFMGSQRLRHNWAAKNNNNSSFIFSYPEFSLSFSSPPLHPNFNLLAFSEHSTLWCFMSLCLCRNAHVPGCPSCCGIFYYLFCCIYHTIFIPFSPVRMWAPSASWWFWSLTLLGT